MEQVSKATITRTALLTLALVNQSLTMAGRSPLPVDDEDFAALLSLGLTVGASLWAWWNNNSFTNKAIAADDYLLELKQEGK